MNGVSSLKFGGVVFRIYPQDHEPRHVHGECGGVEVVVALKADSTVALAERPDRVKPRNAKASHVKKIASFELGVGKHLFAPCICRTSEEPSSSLPSLHRSPTLSDNMSVKAT